MNAFFALALALVVGGWAQAPASVPSRARPDSSPTTRDVEGCPVTVPGYPGFVPPEPYPAEPPMSQAWYGTSALWTLLDRTGAVWSDLPPGTGPHAYGNKTLWFNESFAQGEKLSAPSDITVTAVRLDGAAPKVVSEGSGLSSNGYVKHFALVGVGVPQPGCWEITAADGGTELSYVLYIGD